MQTDQGREALRKERERADTAERELKRVQEKDLPEAERTARRNAELESTNAAATTMLRDARVESSAVRIASKLGFADVDDALGFLALNRSRIDFDNANQPTNVEPLLKDLAKTKPHLLVAGRASGDPRGGADGGAGGGAPQDMNAQIRAAARRG